MEFSEDHNSWRPIPDWVSFLIEFGYAWLDKPHESRNIAVISMPSDSAAAGLVTIGAMRKCLELVDANDMSLHYERLVDIARYHRTGRTLRHIEYTGVFVFDQVQEDGFWVRKLNATGGLRYFVTPLSARYWHIHGEVPVVLVNGQQVPNKQIYSQLVHHGSAIKSSNLSKTHSRICLAGRGAGEAPTRASMANIRFRNDGVEADLSQLLTVQSWTPGTISRVLFYNSRTEEFDRQAGKPQVVIADGDTSFLKVVNGPDFQDSDVIGVVHRTIEREKLEAIGTKLENLRQWYEPAGVDGLPQIPRGIGTLMLKWR